MKFLGLELRHPAHWVAGALIALAILVHPALAVIGMVLFVIYEFGQDRDTAHKDILELMVAFFITVAVMLILNFKEVL